MYDGYNPRRFSQEEHRVQCSDHSSVSPVILIETFGEGGVLSILIEWMNSFTNVSCIHLG